MVRYHNNHTWKRSTATAISDSPFIVTAHQFRTVSPSCQSRVPAEPLPVCPSLAPVCARPAPRDFTTHTHVPKKPNDISLTVAPSLGVYGFLSPAWVNQIFYKAFCALLMLVHAPGPTAVGSWLHHREQGPGLSRHSAAGAPRQPQDPPAAAVPGGDMRGPAPPALIPTSTIPTRAAALLRAHAVTCGAAAAAHTGARPTGL